MQKPLVSIVVPIYNVSKYLTRCIESLQNQSYKKIEIILVDDGSTDGSAEICDEFAKVDSRVRVVHQKNSGVSAARNKGVEIAEGEYISFVDADDWIDPNVSGNFIDALKNVDYDLFCYSAVYHGKNVKQSFLFDDDIELLSQKQKEELHCKVMAPSSPSYEYNCNTRYAGSVWGKFFRTVILKKNGLTFSTKTIISEDVLFNVLALDFFEKVGYTQKTFYHYRLQETSAQNRYRENSMMYFEFIIDEIQDWLLRTGKSQQYHDCANSLFIHYLFGSLKEDYFHRDNPDGALAQAKLKQMLDREKIQNILNSAPSDYFTKSEKVLIMLMRSKSVFAINLLMRLYRWLA